MRVLGNMLSGIPSKFHVNLKDMFHVSVLNMELSDVKLQMKRTRKESKDGDVPLREVLRRVCKSVSLLLVWVKRKQNRRVNKRRVNMCTREKEIDVREKERDRLMGERKKEID